jgi:hypothetical protein
MSKTEIFFLGMVILAVFIVFLDAMNRQGQKLRDAEKELGLDKDVHFKIIIGNYPHCYVDDMECDIDTFQTHLQPYAKIKIDNKMGMETIKATMLANSVVHFDGSY